MAFQDVNAGAGKASLEPVKLTQMTIGDSFTGFVVDFRPSKQNPENLNILMKAVDSDDTFYVYTAGNVKYMLKDGKIKKGLLTQVTRIADKMVGGKKSSQFKVLQDPEQTIDDLSFAAITPDEKTPEVVVQQKSADKEAIKAQAARFASQLKKA